MRKNEPFSESKASGKPQTAHCLDKKMGELPLPPLPLLGRLHLLGDSRPHQPCPWNGGLREPFECQFVPPAPGANLRFRGFLSGFFWRVTGGSLSLSLLNLFKTVGMC